MVDYISMETPEVADLSKLDLCFSDYRTTQAGIKFWIQRATWKNLEIETKERFSDGGELIPVKTSIRRSMHKWYLGYNAGQFKYQDVCDAIELLTRTLKITPEKCRIKGIEYALNLHTSFDVSKTLKNNFIAHRTGKTPPGETDYQNGYMFRVGYSHYQVKCYDKGRESKTPGNILRVEIRITEGCKHPFIKTLADVTRPEVWHKMGEQILKSANGLIIIDNPNPANQICNPKYWTGKFPNRTAKQRAFAALPCSRIKEEILNKAYSTLNELTPRGLTTNFTRNDVTYSAHIPENVTLNDKCLVTGLDISAQRKGSRYASAGTIEDLPRDVFISYERLYLKGRHRGKSKADRARLIAAQIRNKGKAKGLVIDKIDGCRVIRINPGILTYKRIPKSIPVQLKRRNPHIYRELRHLVEVGSGFEPPYEVLQTSA